MSLNSIVAHARSAPSRNAVIANGVTYSYLQFARAILATRTFLEGQRLPESGKAVISAVDLFDCWLLVHALRSLGLDTVCVTSLDMARALNLKGVCCIAFDRADPEQRTWQRHFPQAMRVTLPPNMRLASGRGSLPDSVADRRLGAHILATSGTTGRYKQVALNGAKEDERNRSWVKSFDFKARSRFAALFYPLFTGVGFLKPAAVWSVGGSVLLDQSNDVFRTIFTSDASIVVMTPSLLRSFIASPHLPAAPTSRLRLMTGGGFMPFQLAEQAIRTVTPNLEYYYASTEVSALMLHSHVAAPDDVLWLPPTGLREIQVVNDDGSECPAGQEGLLRIRSTDLDASGYSDDEGAGATVFRDGFFYPGDLAVRRADGRIRVLGRTADVLNVGGIKIAVAPIEQDILLLLGAEEVCVFSRLDEAGRTELVVAVKTDRAVKPAEEERLRERFKQFDRVAIKTLPEFPRAATGLNKTDRRALQKML